jgi:hypothetical protein
MSRFSIALPAKVLFALIGLVVASPPALARNGRPHRSGALAHRARQHLSTAPKGGAPLKAARPVRPAKRGSRHP